MAKPLEDILIRGHVPAIFAKIQATYRNAGGLLDRPLHEWTEKGLVKMLVRTSARDLLALMPLAATRQMHWFAVRDVLTRSVQRGESAPFLPQGFATSSAAWQGLRQWAEKQGISITVIQHPLPPPDTLPDKLVIHCDATVMEEDLPSPAPGPWTARWPYNLYFAGNRVAKRRISSEIFDARRRPLATVNMTWADSFSTLRIITLAPRLFRAIMIALTLDDIASLRNWQAAIRQLMVKHNVKILSPSECAWEKE